VWIQMPHQDWNFIAFDKTFQGNIHAQSDARPRDPNPQRAKSLRATTKLKILRSNPKYHLERFWPFISAIHLASKKTIDRAILWRWLNKEDIWTIGYEKSTCGLKKWVEIKIYCDK